MDQTNVDRALAELEEQHADDPERVEVVRRTRRFKSSWLQLGEALSEVKRGKTWEKWGYDTFETYAKVELKLRMDTVEKLTGSFMFLHKRAPEVLKRDPLESHLPSYQAIDFLRRAEERNDEEHTVSAEGKKTKDRKELKATAIKLRDLLAVTEAVPRRLASTLGAAVDELLSELAADAKAA